MPLRSQNLYAFLVSFLVLAFVLSAEQQQSPPSSSPILGFSPQHTAAEHLIESMFQSIPSPDKAREWHRTFTAEPHPAASGRNNQLADLVADEWSKQGWEEVTLRRYDVLHSRPRHISLEMTEPVHFTASLREDAYDADPDTKNPAVSGSYFGYSASGDVTAEVIYAHSGNPEDYDLLRKSGINVKGKIVLVRYSNPYSYRGFKALTAEREGVAALLIYSDPAEDGYTKGKIFPDGPWGPESHIQRGAITYDYIVPGDPTTPGWASVPGAQRIPPEEARSLPKIPALPLSWRDAKPLLENMNGPEAPRDWQGALPIRYRFTGAVKVHVKVDMDTSMRAYTVVEARIRGSEVPDEWVLLGNHRDAWAFGGVDPSSGTASMMELTRSLGELKERDVRPRRTIVVCSWDGEEYALTGSTEWGEQFADDLRKKLVAYLNVDESVAGAATTAGPDGLSFSPSAVASLAPMLVEASKDVRAPSEKSLYKAWRATAMRDSKASTPPFDSALVETRIGSGSDHTVFLNHLGRPVINLGFTGDYGVYHSMYDDHYWMSLIGDPAFDQTPNASKGDVVFERRITDVRHPIMIVVHRVIHTVVAGKSEIDNRPTEMIQKHRMIGAAADARFDERAVEWRSASFRIAHRGGAPGFVQRFFRWRADVFGGLHEHRRERSDGRGREAQAVGSRGGGGPGDRFIDVEISDEFFPQIIGELLGPFGRGGEK